MTNNAPIRIDIVSDVVCPWCVIGWRQLERAIATTGATTEIVWHPFELNPQMPPEGQDLREHVAEKYGSTPEQSAAARHRITELGVELGYAFAFADDTRIYNTFDAHRLIHWAGEGGKAHATKLALFDAYFMRGRNVAEHANLIDVAESIGLDTDEATAMLNSDAHRQKVREAERFWTSNGIHGVPAMVFERRHLVSGAQGVATFISILSQLIEERDYAGTA